MAPSPLAFPKTRLVELYVRQRLSTAQVAKELGCNHVTVLNYLKKYGIPRRSRLGNRKAVSIDKETLTDLYHNKKFTQKQIAQKFNHSRFGIQRWMKIYGIKSRGYSESHTKYPKHNFSGDLADKAYMIGFRLGDLNVYKVHELIQVRCSTTKIAQVNLIKNLFKQYGNVHIWKAKRGTFEIVVLLNQTFDFLLPKFDMIDEWIMDNSKYFLFFLAGYADAEGSYYMRKPYYKNARSGWGIFEIDTYDKNIIRGMWSRLKRLDIEASFSRSRSGGSIDKRGIKTNKDVWRLTVSKKQSLWNFIKMIEPYHRHQDKLRALKMVKNNLLLRNQLPYCRPITL